MPINLGLLRFQGFGLAHHSIFCYNERKKQEMVGRKGGTEMSKIELRKAETGDEKVLAHIQTESWKSAFGGILSPEELERCTDIQKAEAMYKRVLERGSVRMTIEFIDQKPHCIAGWSHNRNDLGANTAELICIHSLTDKRHQGYGSLMMEHVLNEMKQAGYSEVVLWVFEKNITAIKFYEKHGFVLTDRKQEAHGAAEIMYTKTLETA